MEKANNVILICILPLLLVFCTNKNTLIQPIESSISNAFNKNNFFLASDNFSSPIVYSANDFSGVKKIAHIFAQDIERVTGKIPTIIKDSLVSDQIILIGTIGKNKWIDTLISQGKIQGDLIQGKWEASLIQVVNNPFPKVKRALVIAGSDKRGTIYGMFSLSEAIGVSPWYWWADIPVKTKPAIYIKPGIYSNGEPKVKYRGIFLNDEAPSLSGWVYSRYGEFNSEFYYQVFELILRLKGNYLWPAMWGRTFNYNDTLNPYLADELGIVMGTSHHEPMMRAQQEWKMFGKDSWNYDKNKPVLDTFWSQGIKNMKDHESIVTIGMRGDGDEPMSEEHNIALLEKIVKNQRNIIARVTGSQAAKQPQVWALYKEVQEYYDKGMRVPDDVSLLLCDDNWGNIRKLPTKEELTHPGGYGIYYHFDYVGGPRNYKWLNVTQISRVWEQMNLAYQHGVDKIWIVNVGDLKPMELPISFFLDNAWNPEKYTSDNLANFTSNWAKSQFGAKHAHKIAHLLNQYTNFNARRNPEMLSPETYSLTNYREFETIVNNYNKLAAEAEDINTLLDSVYKDAFYQLVLYPIKACSNLNELYYTTALNRLYAKQNRVATNKLAQKVATLFKTDSLLSLKYNAEIANGKWNHMMDQTHIGYTYWQQPDFNTIPKTETLIIEKKAEMGVAIEGYANCWPENKLKLPEFSPYGQADYYVEIFNKGSLPFYCNIETDYEFIIFSETFTKIEDQKRIEVSINWDKAPKGKSNASIKILSYNGETAIVYLGLNNTILNVKNTFIAANGYVSMQAEHFTSKHESKELSWHIIPNLGKTNSAVVAKNKNIFSPTNIENYLEYDFYTADTGWVDIYTYLSPTLDYKNKGGLEFGLALNSNERQKINMHTQATSNDWNNWVGNRIIQTKTTLYIENEGLQKLKFYHIDNGVVLQKLVVDQGGLKPSYLGPPESYLLK